MNLRLMNVNIERKKKSSSFEKDEFHISYQILERTNYTTSLQFL